MRAIVAQMEAVPAPVKIVRSGGLGLAGNVRPWDWKSVQHPRQHSCRVARARPGGVQSAEQSLRLRFGDAIEAIGTFLQAVAVHNRDRAPRRRERPVEECPRVLLVIRILADNAL